MTQQNAAASEQISSTSDALADQAEGLQQTIGFFRIDEAHPARTRTSARKAIAAAPPRRPAIGGTKVAT